MLKTWRNKEENKEKHERSILCGCVSTFLQLKSICSDLIYDLNFHLKLYFVENGTPTCKIGDDFG